MIKKMILAAATVMTVTTLSTAPVKADAVTAQNMIPVLRAMYNLDMAESIQRDKVAALNACRQRGASDLEIELAVGAVHDINNLVNTLNTMIARDTILIKAAPPGVVNTPSFGTHMLTAQGAWNDFITRERAGHVMLFNRSRVPSYNEVKKATMAFSMY